MRIAWAAPPPPSSLRFLAGRTLARAHANSRGGANHRPARSLAKVNKARASSTGAAGACWRLFCASRTGIKGAHRAAGQLHSKLARGAQKETRGKTRGNLPNLNSRFRTQPKVPKKARCTRSSFSQLYSPSRPRLRVSADTPCVSIQLGVPSDFARWSSPTRERGEISCSN